MPGGGRPQPDPRKQTRSDLGFSIRDGAAEPGRNGQRGAAGSWRDRSPGGDELRMGESRRGYATAGAPALRRLGGLSTRTAILILVGAGLIGVLGTVATGKEPGFLLGFCIVVGSVLAAFTIRRGRLYMLIPMPALLFFIGAVLTGAYHDRSMDTSTTELGVSFLQWIADVFFPMCAATILVVVIAGGRWIITRQLVSGQFAMAGGRAGADRGPRRRPPTRPDPGARQGRGGRDGSPDFDSWGNRDANPGRDGWGPGGQQNRGDRWGNGNPRDDRDDRPRRTF